MFVSAAPPTSTKPLLPGLWRRRSGELGTISEEGEGASVAGAQKEFVHAPAEYADRARDEIRKRLLQGRASCSRRSLDQRSLASSAASVQTSLFSHRSELTEASSLEVQTVLDVQTVVTLEQALPKMFYDMYAPEILMRPKDLLPNGRPKFTKRELLDWDLNDLRSLLIVERLREEWGGQLPDIIFEKQQGAEMMPHFRFQLLRLDSPDETIIKTLVTSDIYLEANLDPDFKLASAQYTVSTARKRHAQMIGVDEPVMRLSKPEWRNIIENYLLNLAVEAQCRFDFRNACIEYKRRKQEQSKAVMPPPTLIPQKYSGSTSLLKRALIRGTYQQQRQRQQEQIKRPLKVSLTKEEKSQIWLQCQVAVYQRLGLDWTPDRI